MFPFLIFMFMITPAYADWPSDCNELDIGKILGMDCNKEKEPRTIFLFKGITSSDWIDECRELGIERITVIRQNEISPKDSITCFYILNLNLTEGQLDIIGKEIQWGKMISLIEDKFIENLSPQLRDCVDLRSDLAVLDAGDIIVGKNNTNVNLPHWGLGLILKQHCTTTSEESEIRGYFDFIKENITFNREEILKMKTILPADYFEEILNTSHNFDGNFVNDPHYEPRTMSPLKQFKSGIPINEIKCKESFQLVTKFTDNSPACVKPETAQKLIERGWAKLV